MIKLFRNIRKKLLNQGKTTNYLKYAIGEIVLVVIGILIALSINNWNENRKNSLREGIFFADVLGDLDKDAAKLEYLENFFNGRTEILTTLLTYVRNPKDTMGIEKFGMHIEPLYYVDDATSYSTTFESAKTSGAFSDFRQKEWLKDLAQYYADFSGLASNLISTRTLLENGLEPIMSTIPMGYINTKTGSLVIQEQDTKAFYEKVGGIKDNRNLPFAYEKILQDPRFEAYLVGDMGRTFNALAKIKKRKENLNSIKNKIETNFTFK